MVDKRIRDWLAAMYERNIENAKTALSEEKWAKDSNSKEEEQMHLDNIAAIQDYIAVLERLKEEAAIL